MRSLQLLALICSLHGSVILVQDAGVDDYMCTVMLAGFEDFHGEVIVNADSNVPSSVEAADQLHRLLASARGQSDNIALSLSRARMYNAFPWGYRMDSQKFLNLTSKLEPGTSLEWPFKDGDAWLEQYLEAHTNVSVVLTTAPTPLTDLFKKRPELIHKLSGVYWMAGAVDVDGNLDPTEYTWNNSKAEWNVYTDPEAGQSLLRLLHGKVPVYLFPLDISNTTPLSADFFQAIQDAINTSSGQERVLHQLVYDAYYMDVDNPYYRLWDTVTAGYLLWKQLYQEPKKVSMEIVTAPQNMGWTRVCKEVSPDCYDAYVVYDFKSDSARKEFIVRVAGV